MPYKIAVTSTNGQTVDAHFGQADRFHIYEVDDSGAYSQTDVRDVSVGYSQADVCDAQAQPETQCGCRHDEQGIKPIIAVLFDCKYVLTAQVGKRPQMLLKRAGITALESPPELSTAVGKLHQYHIRTNKGGKTNEQ